jgi:hypothetical protein
LGKQESMISAAKHRDKCGNAFFWMCLLHIKRTVG